MIGALKLKDQSTDSKKSRVDLHLAIYFRTGSSIYDLAITTFHCHFYEEYQESDQDFSSARVRDGTIPCHSFTVTEVRFDMYCSLGLTGFD